jgi:cell division protein FtsL
LSNLAKKYEQRVEQTTEQVMQPKTKPLREDKRSVITPGEKFLVAIFAIVFCIFAVKIVATESAVYDMNKEIQHMETTIQKQEKTNNDLALEVSELSTYERILERAKELGLNLKEQNVKVVE